MNKVTLTAFSIFVCFTLTGCQATRQIGMLVSSKLTPLEYVSPASGATPSERLYIVESGIDSGRNALLFIGGSGCTSHGVYLGSYLSGLTGNYTAFALEKPAVSKGAIGRSCTSEYHEQNVSEAIMQRNLAQLDGIMRGDHGQFQTVSIFGVSEGAVIASQLAALHPDINRVVLIGSGGMDQQTALRLLRDSKRSSIDVDIVLSKLEANDDKQEVVYGQSLAYWQSFLSIDSADSLITTDMPILAIMGSEDRSEPIESLYYLKDRFAENDKENLTLEVVDGANHTLMRGNKDMKPALFRKVSEFLGYTTNQSD